MTNNPIPLIIVDYETLAKNKEIQREVKRILEEGIDVRERLHELDKKYYGGKKNGKSKD